MARFHLLLCVLATSVLLVACAPSVSPLFRDYEVRAGGESHDSGHAVHERIRAALTEAGWTEIPSDVPNVISTEPRSVSSWGLFRTEVSLDVAPIGDRYVRILFTPIRHSVFGGRTKISYLSGGVRRSILPDLNAAFEQQGFVVLGTPKERDEETRANG